jgi:hypothetical protein
MLDSPVIVHLAQSFFVCALFYGPNNLQVLLIKYFAAYLAFYWLIPSFSGQSHNLLASPILYCLVQSFTASFSTILDNHFTSLSSLLLHNPILYWQIQFETVLFCPLLPDPILYSHISSFTDLSSLILASSLSGFYHTQSYTGSF